MTVVNFNFWKRQKRPKVCLLSYRLIGVILACADESGEVFDFDDVIFRQQMLAYGKRVYPSVWGSLKATVVEVEPVDINVSFLHP